MTKLIHVFCNFAKGPINVDLVQVPVLTQISQEMQFIFLKNACREMSVLLKGSVASLYKYIFVS